MRRAAALVVLAFGLAPPAAEAQNRLLLVNAQVVTLADGQEDAFQGHIVVDRDGRISAIGRGNPPAGVKAAVVFDAGGQVAMPGFVSGDSHLAGRMSRATSLARGDLYYSTLSGALNHLRAGITTVYNKASVPDGTPNEFYLEQLDAEFDAGGHFAVGGPAPARSATASRERSDLLLHPSVASTLSRLEQATVIWNPIADGRLGAGMLDVPGDLKMGMTVGMGFGDDSSEGVVDPFENMRVGLYGLRFRDRDPRGLQPIDMLRLHTIGAARAIHVADWVGTLAIGKLGDIILINPYSPDTGPVTNLYGTLVLACDRLNISNVFVAGNPVFRQGTHVLLNAKNVSQEVRRRLTQKTLKGTP